MSPEQRKASPSMRARTSSRSASCCSRWDWPRRRSRRHERVGVSAILRTRPRPSRICGRTCRACRPDPETVPAKDPRSGIRRPGNCDRSTVAQGGRRHRRGDARAGIQPGHPDHRAAGSRAACAPGMAPRPRSPPALAIAEHGGTRGALRRRRLPLSRPSNPCVVSPTRDGEPRGHLPDGRYVVHVDGSLDSRACGCGRSPRPAACRSCRDARRVRRAGVLAGWRDRAVRVRLRTRRDRFVVSDPGTGRPAAQAAGGHRHTAGVLADGRRMAFVRSVAEGGTVIELANADGSSQRRLARAQGAFVRPDAVAWSPDGKLIAAFVGAMPSQKTGSCW